MKLGQLDAQHGTALLALAGEQPCLVIIEPHLDIVPLGTDSCLSTSDFLILPPPHRRLELLADKLLWRLTDAHPSRTVAQLEPLPVVAQLSMEGGGDRLQLEQPALTLDHDGGSGLCQ